MGGAILRWLATQRDIYRTWSDPERILVYQMGKVGSTSLQAMIPGSLHLHNLYDNHPCPPRRDRHVAGRWQRLGRGTSQAIRRLAIRRRRCIRIITLVRDPYQRNVSMFFQNLPHWLAAFDDGRHSNRTGSADLVARAFNEAFNHDYVAEWFDRELRRFTGIDVYGIAMDPGQAHARVTSRRFDVLLLRFERLAECTAALGEFLGTPVHLVHRNAGSDKWYASVYDEFRRGYRPPDALMERLYGTRYSAHFYPRTVATAEAHP